MNIIELAKEAGFSIDSSMEEPIILIPANWTFMGFNTAMHKFAALVRAPLQAKIDSLMLEYCPDEMTGEQLAEWGKNQKPVKQEPVACPVCCNGYLVRYTEEYCTSCGTICQSPKTIRENAASGYAKAIRAEALEEAAKMCDEIFERVKSDAVMHGINVDDWGLCERAAAIRGLK